MKKHLLIKTFLFILLLLLSLTGPGWGTTTTASLWFGNTAGGNFATSGTTYFPVFGGTTSTSTEANRYLVMPTAGTISDFYAGAGASPTAGTYVLTLMKGGNPQTLTVTLSDANVTTDIVNTVAVVAGDVIDIRLTTTGTPTATYGFWGFKFTPTTADETVLFGSSSTNLSGSATEYISPTGVTIGVQPQTIIDGQIVAPANGTFTKIQALVSAAPGAGGSGKSRTFALNVDGTDSALTTTISETATTGSATGSIAVTAGQLLTISSVPTSTPASAKGYVSLVFVPSTSGQFVLPLAGRFTLSTAASKYAAVIGDGISNSWQTQALSKELSAAAFTAKNIYIKLSAAPTGATKSYTFTLYNGTNTTALTKAIIDTATAGNYATDVSIAAGDALSINSTPANTPASAKALVSVTGYIAPVISDTAPTVTTQAISAIANTTATGNGNVTATGGPAVTAWGVCVNTAGTPTTSDTVFAGSGDGQGGAFTAAISGLTASTRYCVRAYATNSIGTSYGAEVTFQTTPNIYYVDTTKADNSGDGFSTATAKMDNGSAGGVNSLTLNPGDTVKYKCSQTWVNDPLIINYSGSAGSPITITSYSTGAKPHLQTAVAVDNTAWTDDGGGAYHKTVSSTCSWFFEDGHAIYNSTVGSFATDTAPCWYLSGSDIYYKTTGGNDPSNHTLERINKSGGIYTSAANPPTYITIDGLHLSRVGINLFPGATATGGVDNVIIQNCDFDECYKAIQLVTRNGQNVTNCLINANTFNYCGWNIYLYCYTGAAETINCNITNNIITNSNHTFSGADFNTFTDLDGISLQNMLNSTISGNSITDAVTGGIVLWNFNSGAYTGNLISKNFIKDVTGPGIINGSGAARLAQVDIVNNIIVNCGDGGIRLNSPQNTSSLVANNTIYGCAIGIYLYSNPDYLNIKNNIVSNCTVLARADVVVGNNILSNNDYNGGGAGTPFNISGVTKSWAQWTSAYGDANSITSDPAFLNTGGSFALATDFQLQSSSPCINAGVDVGLTADYGDFLVPKGSAPDIGAWEFQSKPTGGLPQILHRFFR